MQEDTMALRWIGKDPDSPVDGSPTVWVDEEDGSFVLQGWEITDEATLSQIRARGPIPDHETVVRLPGRMASLLREAMS
jgi:hypothetical protein